MGLVLSGGGARGAYEVGALLYIAERMPELLERVRVITGTSVGAVNAAHLAGSGLTLDAVRDLAKLWRSLSIDRMVGFDPIATARLLGASALRMILGREIDSPPTGIISMDGIADIVTREVDWRGIRRTIQSGRLDAVAVAATDIATGGTELFVSHNVKLAPRWSGHDPAMQHRRVFLRPEHVLASAAIPILFRPVQIGGRWYMDGGLRYNTPLSPALVLGAESLLILSVRAESSAQVAAPSGSFPGFGQVLGKLFDSVFLDRVTYDLDRLARINDTVAAVDLLGEGAADRLRQELVRRGRRAYRYVHLATVRPHRDLGALAAQHLARAAQTSPTSFARALKLLFQDDKGTTGDAASFLLFDGAYASALIDEGYRDAEASRAELERL